MHPPLLISNRLSVRISEVGQNVEVQASSGGVASALREVQARTGAHWLGWPGPVSHAARLGVTRALDELGAVPVFLEDDEIAAYYEGYSNSVLWPLLHGNVDKLPFDADANWPAFLAVNRRFVDACVAEAEAGAPVWVHDFHLALVPGELRRRVPGARVGFFLHVPFPPWEVFRVLPRATDVVVGLLGADLVGFHTAVFKDAFAAAAVAVGARVDGDLIDFAGHVTRLGVFPIGVDFEKLNQTASEERVVARAAALKSEALGRTILLGVDRLDYTKGLPRRILTIERLMEKWPELAPQVHFIQLAVPTRENVDAYAEFRGVVNGLVGRVNGKFGSATGVPIHFMHRELGIEELVALYRAADVMIVTPLRDGMNLVCKEYVAARSDERGALVLSELAGAAAELEGALLVNPYDIDDAARRVRDAMLMPAAEQQVRMGALRRTVAAHNIHWWAKSFLDVLTAVPGHADADAVRAREARHVHVVVDYDGTLVPIAQTPSQAEPDAALLELLMTLTQTPSTSVYVASGRDRSTLDAWLGMLPVGLVAEHGAHVRAAGGDWSEARVPSWKDDAVRALSLLSETAAGSFVEVKHCSVALHTRGVGLPHRALFEEHAAAVVARVLGNDVEVMRGHCVIEVRDPQFKKSRAVAAVGAIDGDLVIAAGDDNTDEDLFLGLPKGSVSVGVGPRPASATRRVGSVLELRVLLSRLLGCRR